MKLKLNRHEIDGDMVIAITTDTAIPALAFVMNIGCFSAYSDTSLIDRLYNGETVLVELKEDQI